MVKVREPRVSFSLEGMDLQDIVWGLFIGFTLLISKLRARRMAWKEEDGDEGW